MNASIPLGSECQVVPGQTPNGREAFLFLSITCLLRHICRYYYPAEANNRKNGRADPSIPDWNIRSVHNKIIKQQ
jgi:hypothetical protein